jgi:hypothetical protein
MRPAAKRIHELLQNSRLAALRHNGTGRRQFVGSVTGTRVHTADEVGWYGPAMRNREWASRMECAAGRRIKRARRLAVQNDPFAFAAGLGDWNG